jgi:hypothetical protein
MNGPVASSVPLLYVLIWLERAEALQSVRLGPFHTLGALP